MHLTWEGLLASLWGCLPPPWGSKAPLKWGLSGLGLGSSPWGFLGGEEVGNGEENSLIFCSLQW